MQMDTQKRKEKSGYVDLVTHLEKFYKLNTKRQIVLFEFYIYS